ARIHYLGASNQNGATGSGLRSLQSLGFPAAPAGIYPLAPAIEGVPPISLNEFGFGVPNTTQREARNTYVALDNFSVVRGTHTFKVGGMANYAQITLHLQGYNNGIFNFSGSETGNDFTDLLIGAPSYFSQDFEAPMYGRAHYYGLYAEDSWRVKSGLTFNYGLRWEVPTFWGEKNGALVTIVPGKQSVVFPGAPTGLVFPGDPGIPKTLAPTRYNNVAPRLGLAYSPSGSGWLGKLTGAGQTSIRAGYGLFYTSFEGATDFNEIGDAPYGDYYSPSTPTFANPFQNRTNGVISNNPFPIQLPVPQNLNFTTAGFLPIGASPGFKPTNRLPYAEEYELSIQRQFSSSTLLTLSYVGTQAHRLLSDQEANPGSPAICNYLIANGATPTGENNTYVLPLGVAAPAAAVAAGIVTTVPCGSGTCNDVVGTRTGLAPNLAAGSMNFTSDGYFITNGVSAYNSLQVNVRRTAKSLTFLVGY